MPTPILRNLHAYLNAKNITHAQLAQALKLPETTIKRMFARNECSTQRVFDICEWLQIDFADLIEDPIKKRSKTKLKTDTDKQ